jgi:hypothetical protein
MKLRSIGTLMASVLSVTVMQAVAQEAQAPGLPPVLRIFREEVKQGKDTAHEKTEASYVMTFTKYKYPAYSLGCNVVAGPSEAWFFEAHPSMMSIQKVNELVDKNAAMKSEMANLDSLDGELRSGSTTMIAVLRTDLSYRGSEFAKELGKTRYFSVGILRIRPFTDMRFAEVAKQVIAADERANVEVPAAIYQVVSGGPVGTYMIFTPMKSLQTMDDVPERTKAMMAAMGMDKMAALYKNAGEVVTGMQTLLLSINPKISYVSKEMSAQDPDFWTPKSAGNTTKPAAPKTAEKTGAGQ